MAALFPLGVAAGVLTMTGHAMLSGVAVVLAAAVTVGEFRRRYRVITALERGMALMRVALETRGQQ